MDPRDRDPMDPEIIQAGDTPRGAFVEVSVDRGGEAARFRCAISAAGRAVIQRILATQPFGATAGLPYRYFYAGQGSKGGGPNTPPTHLVYVRVEGERKARTIEFESPEDVVSVLQWFRQIPSLEFAAHLRAPA